MKQKKNLSSSAMQRIEIVTLSRKGKPKNSEYVKEIVLDMSRTMYKKAFEKGIKLHDHAILPAIFVVSTDKTTYMINDLEMHYKSREKLVSALRLMVKQFIINGEVLQYFYHFTEVRVYRTKGPNDPFQIYSDKMGRAFPGTPMTTQFMIVFETPNNYALTLYDINNTTGELTDSGNSPHTVIDETTVNQKDPSEYGGLFTHIVYRPEDAVEIEEDMTIIGMKNVSKK